MTCRAWQNLLQQHLDGVGDAGVLEQHLQVCLHCAPEALPVRRLLDGLALLGPAVPPVHLTQRITSRLEAEARHKRRRRRLVSLAGLAAALLLLVVGARVWWSFSSLSAPREATEPVVQTPPHNVEPTRPLRESVADAGTAVASLTSRTASQTVDQTTSLLPVLPTPTLETLETIETPMEPIREAGAEVSAGLAPVADSARRAVGLFFRDLPMGRTERSNKPG